MNKRLLGNLFLSSILIILSLLVNEAVPCIGASRDIMGIRTGDELLDWYNNRGGGLPYAQLEADIIIDRPVVLRSSGRNLDIRTDNYSWNGGELASYSFRIVRGGSLIIEDPNLYIFGIRNLVIVEDGGTLVLNQGYLEASEGENTLILKQGASFTRSSSFHLGGGIVNEAEDMAPGPTAEPSPGPTKEPGPTEQPEPTEGPGSADKPDILLKGELLSVDSDGYTQIRLTIPELTGDITAVYIYRSPDGMNWERAYWEEAVVDDEGTVMVPVENFLPVVNIYPPYTFAIYKCYPYPGSMWLRMEITGPGGSEMTNAVKLLITGKNPSDEDICSPGGQEDGSSGGNRGPTGQGESERYPAGENEAGTALPVQTEAPAAGPEEGGDQQDISVPALKSPDNEPVWFFKALVEYLDDEMDDTPLSVSGGGHSMQPDLPDNKEEKPASGPLIPDTPAANVNLAGPYEQEQAVKLSDQAEGTKENTSYNGEQELRPVSEEAVNKEPIHGYAAAAACSFVLAAGSGVLFCFHIRRKKNSIK